MSTAGKIPNNSSPFQRMWFKTNDDPNSITQMVSVLFATFGLIVLGLGLIASSAPPHYFIKNPGGILTASGISFLAFSVFLLLPTCLYKCVYRKHQDDPTAVGTPMKNIHS